MAFAENAVFSTNEGVTQAIGDVRICCGTAAFNRLSVGGRNPSNCYVYKCESVKSFMNSDRSRAVAVDGKRNPRCLKRECFEMQRDGVAQI